MEAASDAYKQADAEWEEEMERRDVVTNQLFGLRLSTPARARGTSPYYWCGSPANSARPTPVSQRSPMVLPAVDSSPSTTSTCSTANSELAVAGPQVLFSF